MLWGFRGFVNALAPVVLAHTRMENDDGQVKTRMGEYVLWYCFLCVYISYFFEGCVAFFFSLHKAEEGCHIKTPIAFLATWFNWLAYNTFLQPPASLANLFFYFFNGENKKKVTRLLHNSHNYRIIKYNAHSAGCFP